MIEFVSFAGPHVEQDLETRRRIRSRAMRDYRHRQRQSRIANLDCDIEPGQKKTCKPDQTKSVSKTQQGSSACLQRRTSRSHAHENSMETTSKLTGSAIEHLDKVADSRLVLHQTSRAIPYSISSLPHIDTLERYDMHYFHHVVMKDIAGLVCVGFWDEFMPRLCHSEDVARQAIVALSRTHADLAYNGSLRHPPSSRDRLSSSQTSASYLKASKALRTHIEESSSPSYELVLTCSIIFHALELLQGSEENAACHLENGLAMFKAWKRQRDRASMKKEEGFDEIATVLARLDLSATIADDNRVPVFEYDHDEFLASSVTDLNAQTRLTSAHDAHYQLMKVGTPAWAFLVRNRHWRDVPIELVPDRVIQERGLYLLEYRAWSVAADRLEWDMSTRSQDESADADVWERNQRVSKVSLIATRMHHWCSKRMLEEGLQDEQGLRPFERNPHKVLRYARAIIEHTKAEEAETDMSRRMSFSPEIGICGILFLLAHRTTSPSIRGEALDLARHFNRLEGARDLISAFQRWTLLPVPKPTFPYMLGEPGH